MSIHCDRCEDRRHILTDSGLYARCPDCFLPHYDQRFIHPGIRGKALRYPSELDALPPWDIHDSFIVGGDLTKFRSMVWRSLAPHRFTNLAYQFIPFSTLLDLGMGRVQNVDRDAVFEAPLLITTITARPSKSDYAATILMQVLERPLRGYANWIYSALTPARLGAEIGPDLQDSLHPYRKDAY